MSSLIENQLPHHLKSTVELVKYVYQHDIPKDKAGISNSYQPKIKIKCNPIPYSRFVKNEGTFKPSHYSPKNKKHTVHATFDTNVHKPTLKSPTRKRKRYPPTLFHPKQINHSYNVKLFTDIHQKNLYRTEPEKTSSCFKVDQEEHAHLPVTEEFRLACPIHCLDEGEKKEKGFHTTKILNENKLQSYVSYQQDVNTSDTTRIGNIYQVSYLPDWKLFREGVVSKKVNEEISNRVLSKSSITGEIWNYTDCYRFHSFMIAYQKDICAVAFRMKKSVNSVLLYYYGKYKHTFQYAKMKQTVARKREKLKSGSLCCSVCSGSGKLLWCENCDKMYHLHCLKCPLSAVPTHKWFCDDCSPVQHRRLPNISQIIHDKVSSLQENRNRTGKYSSLKSYRIPRKHDKNEVSVLSVNKTLTSVTLEKSHIINTCAECTNSVDVNQNGDSIKRNPRNKMKVSSNNIGSSVEEEILMRHIWPTSTDGRITYRQNSMKRNLRNKMRVSNNNIGSLVEEETWIRNILPTCTDGRICNKQNIWKLKSTYVQNIEVLDQDLLPW